LNELGEWQLALSHYGAKDNEWLPAPSIRELRERLIWDDFLSYFKADNADEIPNWQAIDFWVRFAKWLEEVTASADDLATIWIWKTKH
jgi:hypothetical protein